MPTSKRETPIVIRDPQRPRNAYQIERGSYDDVLITEGSVDEQGKFRGEWESSAGFPIHLAEQVARAILCAADLPRPMSTTPPLTTPQQIADYLESFAQAIFDGTDSLRLEDNETANVCKRLREIVKEIREQALAGRLGPKKRSPRAPDSATRRPRGRPGGRARRRAGR